ncbi:MAG: single-stranded-DNA-specific exonuclease RecJ [Methylococcales bacterium]|nr:single-stranded-DNA-specific exonuclease RecJ [Methylococcales bacterium]
MYFHGVKKIIELRTDPPSIAWSLDTDPLCARILARRGVTAPAQISFSLKDLPRPESLPGIARMVDCLVEALRHQQRITVIADYDADGATACAVAVRGLTLLGFQHVDFLVPNRFTCGYGLTPEIVALAKHQRPDILLTVDNGIASLDGVAAANAEGFKVLITDHHLPGETLPEAAAIVNPNVAESVFPSRALAGVGVMFYVLLALRARLRTMRWFATRPWPEPNLARLLDLVALGTVADVVPLDACNRILVRQGLLQMRQGQSCPGINALLAVAGKAVYSLQSSDLGFAIGPRLNAAGRMDDMTLGIQCLITEDHELAHTIAVQLDEYNRERKLTEQQMQHEAMALLREMKALDERHLAAGLCVHDANWHQGVIGIVASRLKDRFHRPVIAFADAGEGVVKGSARSIEGVHIRDVLNTVATRHPHLLQRFGGHAMAAGLSLEKHNLPPFTLAFEQAVHEQLQHLDLTRKLLSDGELDDNHLTLAFAQRLQTLMVWGHAMPEPVFHGDFEVLQSRIVGHRHLKLVLRPANSQLLIDAIAFFGERPEDWQGVRRIRAGYQLTVNEYRDQTTLQLLLLHLEKLQ